MSDSETAAQRPALGARLRTARERSGLDKQQAAEKLHCDVSIIEALENERFEELGAAVYARGHVRRYSELVGESVGELQELFEQRTAHTPRMPDLTRVPKAERPSDPRSLVTPLAVAGLTLVLAAAAWWVLKGQGPPREAPPAAAAANVPASPAAAGPLADAVTVPANDPARTPPIADTVGVEHNLTSGGAGVAGASVPASAAEPLRPQTAPTSPEAAAAPAQGVMQLRLTAAVDCWIEAYDASGKRIYFGMASPNSVQQITGPSPLRVLLGNVRAIKFEVDGRVVTIPEAVRRGSSAWFAVTADGQIRPTADLGSAPAVRSRPRRP